MIKLEQLVSCPNVLLELGDFFIAQVLEIATTFSMYRMFSVMLKCGRKNMQLLVFTSPVSVLETLKDRLQKNQEDWAISFKELEY